MNFVLTSIVLMLFILGCKDGGGGTTIGNPVVSVELTNESILSAPALTLSKHEPIQLLNVFPETSFCFKRARFKIDQSIETQETDNIDLNIGQIIFDGSKKFLADISIPVGTYRRIELDIKKGCNDENSIIIKNSNGTFSTDDSITLRFEGETVVEKDSKLQLNMNPILSSFESVQSNSEIKSRLESVNGQFKILN